MTTTTSGKAMQLVAIALNYVKDSPKARHEVTFRLKNYTADDRSAAIKYMLNNGLVDLVLGDGSGRGRNPVYVHITQKGLEAMKDIAPVAEADTIWK